MTVENCIKLLKQYAQEMENPPGQNSSEKEFRKQVATKAYENMKQHILKSRKFNGHPILSELEAAPKKADKKTK